jgi:hypothetical protein
MSADDDALLSAVARRMGQRSASLVEAQLHELRRLRAYDRVPDDDLRRSCHRNVARVIATLERHDRLPSDIEEDERMSGRRRALQGVPVEDLVEAYRVVLSVLRDAFIEEASAVGADPWAVLRGTRRLWDLTDRYSNVLVSARQQVEIEAARRDERHRIEFVQRLLWGVEPEEMIEGSAVHGVLPDREYWVVRARQRDGGSQRLSRHLELPAGGTTFRPLVAPIDGDVVGIGAVRPSPLDAAVIAVAGPTALPGIPQAFAEATRVLEVAWRYGRTGVVDRASLSVRVAVEQHKELSEELYQRYVGGRADGAAPSDDLLRTLRTYLHSRRSVAATAQALSVHENTVRYRLERYQAVTGADLAVTDTLVEVWWALEYAGIRTG